MEVLEAIKTRSRIRAYKPDPVPEEVLEEILEAGRWAPSAANSQPWEFIVFTDPEIKRRLARAFMYGPFLVEAPVGIMVVVDFWKSPCQIQDGTLAAYSMMLAAHGLGLGTCWVNPSVNESEVKEILGIPREKQVICALALGYPAEAPTKERKKLKDMVYRERWGKR